MSSQGHVFPYYLPAGLSEVMLIGQAESSEHLPALTAYDCNQG